MENVHFRHIPAEFAVYKVQEDCCYMKVVYNGPKKGVYSVIDHHNEEIGPLLCCICDPKKEIEEVSGDFFQNRYQMVMQDARRA